MQCSLQRPQESSATWIRHTDICLHPRPAPSPSGTPRRETSSHLFTILDRSEIYILYTCICINRWKFQGNYSVGVALTSIWTFYAVWSLGVSGDLTLGDLGLKFSQHMRKRCMIRCAKNGNLEKTGGGLNNPPSGRRLNKTKKIICIAACLFFQRKQQLCVFVIRWEKSCARIYP